MAVKSGDIVDRYQILAPLGAGGMGEVYQALDLRLQRQVALKLLSASKDGGSQGDGSRGAARILREARAAAALEHPNVVAIFDVGEVHEPESLRGTAYLAMELIRGQSLRVAARDASVPISERLRWLEDIARALSAAHEQGLVHRDVKPENVMIRSDGVVKVLDFGIAKRSFGNVDPAQSTEAHILSTLTTKGIAVGTPYYMAPEQMRGEPLDGRADQFSWGVLAYELLAGHGPWRQDGDALSLVSEVLSKPAESPRDLNPSIPLGVTYVILKALSKARDDRFATMERVLVELRRDDVVAPSPTPSPPPPRATDGDAARVADEARPTRAVAAPRRPARRRPWLAIGGAALVVAAAVAGNAMRPKSPASSVTTDAAPVKPAKLGDCSTSAQCTKAHGGAAHRCREDGLCAPLASEDCTVHAEKGDIDDDATVWVGAMYPLTGPSAAQFGRVFAQGVELARQDFAQTMGGVVGKNGRVRPIGLVSCDDAADAERAARHLARDVQVPAVIGFRSGTEFVTLAKTVFVPAGTVMMASLSTSPLVTAIPQPPGSARLTWRTTYNIAQTAAPISALVTQVFEPQVRARREPAARAGPVKIGLLRFKNAGHLAFAEALYAVLRWNGVSAVENAASYRQVVVDDPAAPDARPDYAAAVKSLSDLRPDILVVYGGEALLTNVVEPLEAAWPAGARGRPIYVDPTTFSGEVIRFVGKNSELRHRFFALGGTASTSTNARLVMHYNEVFADKITRTLSPNTDYDAFYLLAYAILSLGDQPVRGSSIAAAFARLQPPARTVDVGPSRIFDVFNALERGENVDLNGATGPLDFDLATGEAAVDQAVLCVGVDDKGNATEGIESGMSYSVVTKRLEGEMKCP